MPLVREAVRIAVTDEPATTDALVGLIDRV